MARSSLLPPSGAILSNQHQSCGPDMSPWEAAGGFVSQGDKPRESSVSSSRHKPWGIGAWVWGGGCLCLSSVRASVLLPSYQPSTGKDGDCQ